MNFTAGWGQSAMKNPVMQLAMLQGQSGPDHRRVQCDQQMIEVSRSRRLPFAHYIIWATFVFPVSC